MPCSSAWSPRRGRQHPVPTQSLADAEGDGDDTPAWRSPIGNPESTWKPEYADVREDRVVVYGYASHDVQEFVYRIKATNAGKFAACGLADEALGLPSLTAQPRPDAARVRPNGRKPLRSPARWPSNNSRCQAP